MVLQLPEIFLLPGLRRDFLVRVDVAAQALGAGFLNEPGGVHTSKTMMLPELRDLLAAAPGPRSLDQYAAAALEGNALRKATAATRTKTFSMMRALYALRGSVPLFAGLRELWSVEAAAQPMLALLAASARDPLLRATADHVLALPVGAATGPVELAREVELSFPHRYSRGVLHHVGQNTGASWVQAGLLTGRATKHRTRALVTMPAVAYALYLGHLEGLGGQALLNSFWVRLLDTSQATVISHAESASRAGWLDYASLGGMMEIQFRHLDELVATEAA